MPEQLSQDEVSGTVNTYTHAPAARSLTPLREPLNSRCEACVEDALDHVFARLVAILPYEERFARRTAMRAELDTEIAAHIELGSTAESAVEHALASLVKRNALANQALSQTRAARSRTKLTKHTTSARHSTLIAFLIFCLPYLGAVTNKFEVRYLDSFGYRENFYALEIFAIPLLAGLATGLIAKSRALRGVLNTMAVIAVFGVLLPSLIWGFRLMSPSFAWGLDHHQSGFIYQTCLFMADVSTLTMCGITMWTIMGCIGAAAGSRIRGLAQNLRHGTRSVSQATVRRALGRLRAKQR